MKKKNHRTIQSQNGWSGKEPLEMSWSNYPAQIGWPTAHCPGPCSDIFCMSPRRDTTHLPGQPVHVLSYPCNEKLLHDVQRVSVCASGPVTTEKSLALSSLYPPFRYLYSLIRLPVSLLFARQSCCISLSFALMELYFSHINIFMALLW